MTGTSHPGMTTPPKGGVFSCSNGKALLTGFPARDKLSTRMLGTASQSMTLRKPEIPVGTLGRANVRGFAIVRGR